MAPPWVEIRAVKPEGVEYGLFYKAEFRFLADAKPRVLQAAAGRGKEVFLDGGIRRGTDVVKALALGAKGCFIGRP